MRILVWLSGFVLTQKSSQMQIEGCPQVGLQFGNSLLLEAWTSTPSSGRNAKAAALNGFGGIIKSSTISKN